MMSKGLFLRRCKFICILGVALLYLARVRPAAIVKIERARLDRNDRARARAQRVTVKTKIDRAVDDNITRDVPIQIIVAVAERR